MSDETWIRAGVQLRVWRNRMGLSLRDVEERSRELVKKLTHPDYVVSSSYLDELEIGRHCPSIRKLYTLSMLYRVQLMTLVELYGVSAEKIQRAQLELAVLFEDSRKRGQRSSKELVESPETWPAIRDSDRTHLLVTGTSLANLPGEEPSWRVVANGQILHGAMGSKDWTMYPLVPPTSRLYIDSSRRQIEEKLWRDEYERPIYFLERLGEFFCGWCAVRHSELMLIPHPLSPAQIRTFRYPGEVEMVGQVTAVTIPLIRDAGFGVTAKG